jgi:hypothetical protein
MLAATSKMPTTTVACIQLLHSHSGMAEMMAATTSMPSTTADHTLQTTAGMLLLL